MLNDAEKEILSNFQKILMFKFRCDPAQAEPAELHDALAGSLMLHLAEPWAQTEKRYAQKKQVYYFSAEFLVGRAIFNNLLAMQLTGPVKEFLESHGSSLNQLEEIEDAALGNGGLGRLAACFLDSAATLGIPVTGCGIRYRYGLFRQDFEDGFQIEKTDDWTRFGDPWSVRMDRDSVVVRFADQTVRAVPYEMPIIGYGGKNINTLRLWQSEPVCGFDFKKFNDQEYDEAVEEKNRAEDICRVLYPNDDTNEGKILRIRQQYFFCSASIQHILRRYCEKHGSDFQFLPAEFAIQLNDTHPTVAICELVRLLTQEYGVSFEKAFGLAQKTFRYTNHTVMAEALEKWDKELFTSVLPDIVAVAEQIDALQKQEYPGAPEEEEEPAAPAREQEAEPAEDGEPQEDEDAAEKPEEKETDPLAETRILRKGSIHMANLAVYGSCAVNGVAKLHTEILKQDVLKDWYALRPGQFHNVTNGITPRRWLALCNPELSGLVTELLGTSGWVTRLDLLKKLEAFTEDAAVLDRFAEIKRANKRRLSEYIAKREGAQVPAGFLFDIQIKRLHEYKRQFLNALSILDLYFSLKDGEIKDFTPTAFLFGAKAAPGYARAKGIIKMINEIARLIDADPAVRDKMRVVFVRNYDVSWAEKLVCAADLSEQISTAGTEASGTGNMKFMLNGAPTLGTWDGANIEIVQASGMENNYIFGARVEELDAIRETYDPVKIYESDARVRRVLDTLTDGTLDDGGTGIFEELKNSILKGASWHRPDQYFLLKDFESYRETRLLANRDFRDVRAFSRKGLMNTANAGYFSSDRSVMEYARNIWDLPEAEL